MLSRINGVGILSVVVVVLASSANRANATLRANWKFDETSGLVANDATVSGNHGTLGGSIGGGAVPTLGVAGAIGTAFSFNGSSQYVFVPDSTTLHNYGTGLGLTLNAWVKMASSNTPTDQSIFRKWDPAPGYILGVVDNHSGLGGVVLPGTGFSGMSINIATAFSNGDLDTTDWHMLTITHSSTGTALYLDGVLKASNASGGVGNQASTGSPLYIGAWGLQNGTAQGNYWNGGLDDLGVWDEGLNAAKVRALYNAPTFAGLQGTGHYGQFDMEKLFTLFSTTTGTEAIGSLTWQYMAAGFTGHAAGDVWSSGGAYFIQLDADGSGVMTSAIPEPSSVALLGIGSLVAGVWFFRRQRLAAVATKC